VAVGVVVILVAPVAVAAASASFLGDLFSLLRFLLRVLVSVGDPAVLLLGGLLGSEFHCRVDYFGNLLLDLDGAGCLGVGLKLLLGLVDPILFNVLGLLRRGRNGLVRWLLLVTPAVP